MGGLSFLKDPLFPGWSLACGVFVSHLPRVKSRKPAFHFSQEDPLLRRKRQKRGIHVGCPWSPSGTGWGVNGLALFLVLLPFPPTFRFVAPLKARTFSGIVFLTWHLSGRRVCVPAEASPWWGGLEVWPLPRWEIPDH